MRRKVVEARFAATQAELNEERAGALERLGRRVSASHERYLAAVAALDGEADHGAQAEHRAALAAFEALRWELTVHREALGLTDHRWLDRTYPLADRDRRRNPDPELSDAQRRMMAYRLSR